MTIPTLPGISSKMITTSRLTTRVLFSGDDKSFPVLFLHGNASSATYWEDVMLALPEGFRGIAPDQRGYGDADRAKKIDATRGMSDFADDAIALLDTLGIDKVHIAGHSMGGSVIWQLLIDHPDRFLSVTLAAPGSPYGFGGTKDNQGTANYADFTGSGGGTVNPTFTQLMAAGERGSDNPQASPRVVMNSFYWKPPFKAAREEELLSSLLSEHIGAQEYPGDMTASENWPNVAPGVWGPANALSPKYTGDVSRIWKIAIKPRILWVRGESDQIVSDQSLFDFGTLGALGAVPGWPGADIFPSQPMVSQTRTVLDHYKDNGGEYTEAVLANVGHTPYIEQPEAFNKLFHDHLKA
ncbi:MAG: alpha/beta fold hydrolase [Anaerolineaceae bacterium]|nr:alpha/beta fold hydrolase [Anaerolineaceae bacterium]